MANFIKGTLESIEAAAIYQGSIFTSDLKLRHASGVELTIFDDVHQISQNLSIGEVYEVVLVPTVVKEANYFSSPTQNPVSGFGGKIIELKWSPHNLEYQFAVPELHKNPYGNERTWIQVQTRLGDVIISHGKIRGMVPDNIDAGGFLQWQASRMDLYAVV